MEMEYKDPSKRGRWIVVLGLVLAVAAAAGAFYVINNAQQSAGRGSLKYTTGVVAARPLAAKKTLTADDLTVRSDIPLDTTNSMQGMVPATTDALIGRVLGVDVAQNQLVTLNLLASTSVGGQFPILGPGETVAPDSDAWRAVSITVADDRAVGGLLAAGMTVDVILSESFKAPPVGGAAAPRPAASVDPNATPTPAAASAPPGLTAAGPVTDGMSTKVSYQDMRILARQGTFYVLKATLAVAEEITQIAIDGGTFSLVLRPDQDTRILDVSALGATTSRILQRYGLLVPQTYPVNGAIPSQPPIPPVTPPPSPPSVASPDASGAPSAAPAGG